MIQVFINGEEVICDKNIILKESILNISSAILSNVMPKAWDTSKDYVSNFYTPKDYSRCEIYKDGSLYFCGYTKNSGNVYLNPRYPKFIDLEVLDYKGMLSEGKILDIALYETTVSDSIARVINEIADYGFILGTVSLKTNQTINSYSCANKTAYDVFQYLAELSGSRWRTRIKDEKTVYIDFYDADLLPVASDIDYTQTYWETNNIIDMTWNYGTRDYRNTQMLKANQVFAETDTSQSIISDGASKIYLTEYNVGTLKTVLAGGVYLSIGTKDDQNNGIYADIYYTPGQPNLYLKDNLEPLIAGTTIVATYTAMIDGRETVNDYTEIDRIALQNERNGAIVRYEDRSDITSAQDLRTIAKNLLKFKGKPEITLTIKTKDVDLFNIGERTYFNISLDYLKSNYMVKTKTTEMIQSNAGGRVIFYTYELNSNFEMEEAINFFDNQRRKAENLGDITVTRTITNKTNVTIDTSGQNTAEITPITNQLKAGLGFVLGTTING